MQGWGILAAAAQNHFIGQSAGKGGKVLEGARGEKRLCAGVMQNGRFSPSQLAIDGAHLVHSRLPVRSYKCVAELGENTIGFFIVQVNVRPVQVGEAFREAMLNLFKDKPGMLAAR